jgi:hypothetical protein
VPDVLKDPTTKFAPPSLRYTDRRCAYGELARTNYPALQVR